MRAANNALEDVERERKRDGEKHKEEDGAGEAEEGRVDVLPSSYGLVGEEAGG